MVVRVTVVDLSEQMVALWASEPAFPVDTDIQRKRVGLVGLSA